MWRQLKKGAVDRGYGARIRSVEKRIGEWNYAQKSAPCRTISGGGGVMKDIRLRYSKGVIASMQTVLKFMANATEQTSISLRNKRSMYSARARGELCQKVLVSEAGGQFSAE